jgi:glycosyltransferase involved in cell wall biosynthesis
VIAGKNGFLVEPKNPGQVAEKIDYLVSHPETRRQMGEESRKLYRENFTEEKMVERLRAAFQEILDRRGG